MAELTPRLRLLIAVLARVALVVVALQLTALDHHFSPADVVGIEGSSVHTLHCHGEPSGCADAGSGAVLALEGVFVLPREAVRPLALSSATLPALTAVSTAEAEPPRL
jgi:hypothetical protein